MDKGSNGKAIRAGMGYAVANILAKGITFISLPVFARLLSVGDYGVFSTYASYVGIFTIIVGLALHTSIKNAKSDLKEKVYEYCSSITLLIWFTMLASLIAACFFSQVFARWLMLEKPVIVVFIVIESFAGAMINFFNEYLAIEYKYREYLAVSLAYAIGNVGLSLLFILLFFRFEGYMGRILGTTLAGVLICVYFFFRIYRRSKPKANPGFWKYGLKISIPIIPHGLSQIVLAQFDRIMIKHIYGNLEAGMYSFAYNVGMIFQVITNSLDTAWNQWFFDRMDEKEYGIIRRASSVYVIAVSAGAALLMLISPEIITVLGGSKYAPARHVAIPIVLAMFYSFMYNQPSAVEYYYKKTHFIAIGTVSAAVLNIILNAVFIPKYGYVAAAYTTVVCYLVYYMLHLILAWKVHGSMIHSIAVHLGCVGAVTVCMLAFTLLTNRIWIRMGILAAGIICMAVLALKYKNELTELVKNLKERS
ncbi:MAG: oligosaccharide flippase family protein [Lachnospiraceae bacterium]|jgi:O-antigen/teichoic acid export membrane protein